jgi:hypothetical protein
VRNLEKYFEGYDDDKVLDFCVVIHKAGENKYSVQLEVADPEAEKEFFTIHYYPGHLTEKMTNWGNRRTYADIFLNDEEYKFPELNETWIMPPGLCVLKGWNTERDGSGVMYLPGQVEVLTEDLVLHAI